MKYVKRSIATISFAFVLFLTPALADSVNLPARGVSEGTQFSIGCGDGKVLIGLKGKMGMFLGQLEGLCRTVSTDGQWLGSTSSTQASGGAGGIYPIIPQSFSISCPEDTAVEGLSGRFNQFVVRITLNCFSQAPIASGIGVARTVSAPIPSEDSTAWEEDRCPNGKPGRGFHGRFTTAGVRSIGLVCHSGSTPNLEVLAAPNGVAAINLVGPNGPQASTVTPFVQLQWIDRSTIESGYRLEITRSNGGAGSTTIERSAASGVGSQQAVNVTDLAAGGYFFRVCAKFSAANGGDRCSIPLAIFSIAQAATCSPTITGAVELVGAGTARVRWSHPCANPLRFQVQLRSAVSGNFIGVSDTTNGEARDDDFTGFAVGVSNEVRVCAIFQGQGANSFCSAPRAFLFNVPGP